ncbi:MAG TPA: endonuclease/exonuclease/phosphatase family protein [Sedimentisphaerales bacterium]|nr:endonuclease/exonuclease/phosphatase family protein [Sedimentisphaerales bacterium]
MSQTCGVSRRTIVSIALLVGLVCSVCSCFAAEPDRIENELHVMSFNIRYGTADDGPDRWENRRQQVCELIDRNKCDVIGLQEALRFQIDAIREALPVYAEIGVGRDDGRTKGEYSAILYRTDRLLVAEAGTFWLSDTPEVPGSMTWGNKITRICTWGRFIHKPSRKAFYHFNTHFDHQSQPSREKSAVRLAQRIRDRRHPDPVIVTGDFNAGESNPAVRYLKGDLDLDGKTPIPFVDSFRRLHPEATEVGTFHAFKGTRSADKIDYIFVQPDAEVLEARILYDNVDGRYPSDHFPITARLVLPD